MHGFIVGMVKRLPIHLAVVVDHPAMVGLGPLGGKAVETGLVIASRDAVAADAVGARMFGFGAQAVRHPHEAGLLGLGEADVGRMRMLGLDVDDAFRLFTRQVYGHAFNPPRT